MTSSNLNALISYLILGALFSCSVESGSNSNVAREYEEAARKSDKYDSANAYGRTSYMPIPYSTKNIKKEGKTIGWPDSLKPKAPPRFVVEKYAEGLRHPRWLYTHTNGDVFVAESDDTKSSANQITLLRDTTGNGRPDVRKVFMDSLRQPFGMLVLGDFFYVANVNAVWRFPFQSGQSEVHTSLGYKIVDLPAGGYNHHWTRNILASEDGSKIYVTVGSSSNVGEHGMNKEERRACILQIAPNGENEQIWSHGLRNPVGLQIHPVDGKLYTVVNERDGIGDNLVPDFFTSVEPGSFYGWPYFYWGAHIDPRWEGKSLPDSIKKPSVPDMAIGGHTASLGLLFYEGDKFPEFYRHGAFITQHGSWNRTYLNGYCVLFVPFEDGQWGAPEVFLDNFIADINKNTVYGRPVGIAQDSQGALLITDDDSNTIWRVDYVR